MKNLIIIVAGIAIIGGLAATGHYLGSKNSVENEVKNPDTNQEIANKESAGNKDGNYFETLTDLMKRGKSMKCTYTQEVEGGGTATGVVYMADKKARTEITTSEGTGHAGKMYALVDHEWTYSWAEGSSQGYKMTLKASEPGEKNEKTISDMSKKIKFECKSWKKDNSKFKVPTNIEFQDLSEMMEGFKDVDMEKEIKNAGAQANEFLCNHCKNAPTPELMKECLGDVVCE